MKNLILSVVFIAAVIGGIVYVTEYIFPFFGAETDLHNVEGLAHPQASDVSSCKVIGVGSKACGGPVKYVIYSTETTDVTKLESAVATYNAEQKAQNQQNGTISDCSLVQPPELEVLNGRCVAKPSQ